IFNSLVFCFFHKLNFLFKLLDVLWDVDVFQMHSGTDFIHYIYCLVRQKAVADISVAELDTGFYGFVRILNMMVLFVLGSNVLQYMNGLLRTGWIYDYLLESPV